MVAGFGLRPRQALIALAVIGAVTMVDGIQLTKLQTGQLVVQTVLVIPGIVWRDSGSEHLFQPSLSPVLPPLR